MTDSQLKSKIERILGSDTLTEWETDFLANCLQDTSTAKQLSQSQVAKIDEIDAEDSERR
jgi:hypothetical protein